MIFGFFWVRQFFIFTVSKLDVSECLYCRWKVKCSSFSLKNGLIHKNRKWLSSDRQNYIFAQKWLRMGSIIGHRMDYNGVGAMRDQWHIPSKNFPNYPLPPPAPGYLRQIKDQIINDVPGSGWFLKFYCRTNRKRLLKIMNIWISYVWTAGWM